MPLPGLIIGHPHGKVEFIQTKLSFGHWLHGALGFKQGIFLAYCLYLSREGIVTRRNKRTDILKRAANLDSIDGQIAFTVLSLDPGTLNGNMEGILIIHNSLDFVCLSDIIEKQEEIPAVFQGALIESGKFEYTDVEGKLQHGNISEDLSNDDIAQMNRDFSRRERQLQIIRRIVSYSSGRKKENAELTGIVELPKETTDVKS